MTAYKSDLLRQLDARGYIHQTTDAAALDALASKEIVPGYIGFDATAPSLHVGNLVSIMLLRRLQQAGHKPVVVMGGGTDARPDAGGDERQAQGGVRQDGLHTTISTGLPASRSSGDSAVRRVSCC